MKDKKKIVIGTLCALIMIMAVGYALLSQQLSINGSTAITSNWQVEITNIRELEKSTGTTTNSTNYTATTASFNTSLTSPGDYALYEVTVTNKGTLDAVLSAKPTMTSGNNAAITYELEGIKKGDKILKNNGTDTFTLKVTYNSITTNQPENIMDNLQIVLNYEQDLGQVVVKDKYNTGDKILFSGDNWYVIHDDGPESDYVIAIREKTISNSRYGYVEGYPSTFKYSIPDILQKYIESNLDENSLKKVNGTKIRLITLEDLGNYLGYTTGNYPTSSYKITENTPTWVYQNFSDNNNCYWTNNRAYYNPSVMEVYAINLVSSNPIGRNNISSYVGTNMYCGVRPVINLLKSAIE